MHSPNVVIPPFHLLIICGEETNTRAAPEKSRVNCNVISGICNTENSKSSSSGSKSSSSRHYQQ
jgi:hypothetical protein